MNDAIRQSLAAGHLIDITTTGRKSGESRRIEIAFHNMDGRLIITGMPFPGRRRGWLANLVSHPNFTFHLKDEVKADLAATAREITDEAERRSVADWIVANAWPKMDAAKMAADSPMIEVTIDVLAA